MKNILRIIAFVLLFVVVFAIVFAIFSFVIGNANYMEWAVWTRVMVVFVTLIANSLLSDELIL